MVKVIFAVLILTLAGCAQPNGQYVKKVETKTDLGSQLDLSVSYHERSDGGIVVSDSYNQRARMVRLWFWHKQETRDQQILRGIMYYEGSKKKHREVFQVPPAEEGLTETFWLDVFDQEGKLLMKSEPIVTGNSHTGGTP